MHVSLDDVNFVTVSNAFNVKYKSCTSTARDRLIITWDFASQNMAINSVRAMQLLFMQ